VKALLAGGKSQWIAAAIALGAGVAGVGLIAVGVSPGSALAIDGRGSGSADPLAALSPTERKVATGLRELIESCHGFLDAGVDAQGRAWAALWRRDAGEPGRIERSDLLLLLHVPLLRTIEAISFPDEEEEEEEEEEEGATGVVQPTAFRSDGMVAWMRALPDAERRVIATNVRALEVRRSGRVEGAAVLRVTLTWAVRTPDGPHSATIEARLPEASEAARLDR